jgi:hypothetical protein
MAGKWPEAVNAMIVNDRNAAAPATTNILRKRDFSRLYSRTCQSEHRPKPAKYQNAPSYRTAPPISSLGTHRQRSDDWWTQL